MVRDELHRLIDEVLGDDARSALVCYRKQLETCERQTNASKRPDDDDPVAW
jgi:hypothetical protein